MQDKIWQTFVLDHVDMVNLMIFDIIPQGITTLKVALGSASSLMRTTDVMGLNL